MSCYVLQVCIWYILIHYVYVMCMLFVCNMMLTLQRREISRKTKSPTSSERTLRRGHGRRAQRWTCSAAVFTRAEPTLRGTARKTLISQRSDERNRPVTGLSQTCHSPRMGSQAQCGKWPFNHLGICWFIWSFLELTSDDFSWRLKAIECSST